VESLIKSGALDSLDPDRGKVFGELPTLLEEAQAEVRRRESGQYALFGETSEGSPRKRERKGEARRLRGPAGATHLREGDAGLLHHGHPMDSFAGEIAMYANTTTGKLHALKHDAEVRIGGLVTG